MPLSCQIGSWPPFFSLFSLVHIKRLNSLEWLNLSETRITDAGLKNLEGLTSLRWLSLRNTRISAAGLLHLNELDWLKGDREGAFWRSGGENKRK